MIQWLYQQDGVHFDAETMRSAAALGQLEVCKCDVAISNRATTRHWLYYLVMQCKVAATTSLYTKLIALMK
jgi:hypothetical protein